MMSIPCILTFVLIAVSSTEYTHEIPECPERNRALSENLRDQLFSGILAQKPDLCSVKCRRKCSGMSRSVHTFKKYNCTLELTAARMLERKDREKTMDTLSKNKSRLFFEKEDANNGVAVVTKTALDTWKDYFSQLGHRESVGCNYVFEDNKKHKYICLFE